MHACKKGLLNYQEAFLNNARDSSEQNTIFIAICDGNYYKGKEAKENANTKLERLERLTDRKTTFVKTIEEIEPFLRELSVKQI